MQYWIIFMGGVGGDGFANLLEHANGITPVDHKYRWREHYVTQGKTKFWHAKWCVNNHAFRGHPVTDAELTQEYIQLVEGNQRTLISAHYDYWDQLPYFAQNFIVTHNQMVIHLYSKNFARVAQDCLIKNNHGLDSVISSQRHAATEITDNLHRLGSRYDLHIDIEQVWQDWNYLDQNLKHIGIDLDRKWYDEYIKLKGN
jgi:hypothetical protein